VELLCVPRAHSSRLRDLALLPPASSGGRLLVATASSDGSLKAWDLSAAAAAGVPGSGGAECLGEAHTRARLTCLATADVPGAMRRQLAAAAAAAQPRGGQQGQQDKGKRKAASLGAAWEPSRKPKKPAGNQRAMKGAERQQPAGGGKAKPGQKAKGKAEAAAPAAAPGDGVVVHDGVVEFLDSPAQQQKQKKKQKDVAARRKAAGEHGKRFRSLPGQPRPGGGPSGPGGKVTPPGKPRKPRR
jgi:hypothetical protein